ncbi:MAG: hypothetical protein ACREMY_32025, partial [bacterium]
VIVASPPCQAYSYRAMPWKHAKALPPPDNTLFDACFRIQREASEAAGRYIPMVVENVRGAEKWVGPAKWHFGSYYLWGDVPALMPTTKSALKWGGCNGKRFDERPKGNVAAHREGSKIPDFRFDGSGSSFQKTTAHLNIRGGHGHTRHLTNQREHQRTPEMVRQHIGVSRKAASAQIAKIPFPLAQHIARVFKPQQVTTG